MITKLRLIPDYHCYPVWLHDEQGYIVDTMLPEELRGDTELDAKFRSLQDRFDALYLDDGHEFSYIGFRSDAEEAEYLSDWRQAVEELKEKTRGRYEVVDDIGVLKYIFSSLNTAPENTV